MTTKFYLAEPMKKLRRDVEKKILRWPNVSTKTMFGCPCYEAKGKLFAFLVTDGLVVTRLDKTVIENVLQEGVGTAFRARARTVRKWVRFQLKNSRDLDRIMPYVKRSYKSAC